MIFQSRIAFSSSNYLFCHLPPRCILNANVYVSPSLKMSMVMRSGLFRTSSIGVSLLLALTTENVNMGHRTVGAVRMLRGLSSLTTSKDRDAKQKKKKETQEEMLTRIAEKLLLGRDAAAAQAVQAPPAGCLSRGSVTFCAVKLPHCTVTLYADGFVRNLTDGESRSGN
mgnify:CR=1 FL=1